MGDNDSPAILGGRPTPQGYLRSYIGGFDEYNQEGTKVDPLHLQRKYAQAEGGPLFDETVISGSPSFDLSYPTMPMQGSAGRQSIEGIPNATPAMLRKLVDRKIKNTGGQELPGFLKGV